MLMKRLLFTLVAWGAVLLPMAAQAQRGMGSHGFSAPAARGGPGFVARPAGGGHPTSFAARPMPMGRVAPAGIRSAPAGRIMVTPQGRRFIPGQRSFVSRSRFGFNRRFHNRFRNRRFFNDFDADDFGCFNGFNSFGCANPFLYSGYGYPYYDPFFTNYSSQPEQQPVVVEEGGSRDRELAAEVQELSDEIQMMREEQHSRESQKTAQAQPAPKDDSPNAILVFRDGLQLPVRNYAIAKDMVWVLDKPSQKIPIAKLDLPATQQVNEKNGLEIHLPK
jgi:hypothetical protein